MRWKWIITAVGGIIILLIVTTYVVLRSYDFNKIKPQISNFVKDATGRELILGGDLVLDIDFTPSLSIKNVTFENASWGSRPELAKIKQLKVEVALLPLIRGNIDVKQLILTEPEILVETDPSGKSNLAFKPADTQKEDTIIPLFAFNQVRIEKGRLKYRDGKTSRVFALDLDLFRASASDFKSKIELEVTGRFNENRFEIKGEVGSTEALILPGRACSINLAVKLGSASFTIDGSIKDTVHFKGLTGTLTAKGPSISELLETAGVAGPSDIGAFHFTTKLSDTTGTYKLETMRFQAGTDAVAEVTLSGAIENLNTLQGARLNFEIKGKDIANLEKLLRQPIPVRGAFSVSGKLSNLSTNRYEIDNFKMRFGENTIEGAVGVDLIDPRPVLTITLSSQNLDLRSHWSSGVPEVMGKGDLSDIGPFQLAMKLVGPAEQLMLENMDMRFGSQQRIETRLKGTVNDLNALKEIAFDFLIQGNDVAHLEKFTGHPLPFKGTFAVSGKAFDTAVNNYKVDDLKVVLGETILGGTMDLDFTDAQPRIAALLSSSRIVLKNPWTQTASGQSPKNDRLDLGPLNLKMTLTGPIRNLSLEAIEFNMGNEKRVEAKLTGAVKQIVKRQGVLIDFSVRGKDVQTLGKLIGRPLPVQGAFSISGKVTDTEEKSYRVDNLKLVLSENELQGWMDINPMDGQLRLAADLSAQRFNLRSLSNKNIQNIDRLKRVQDFGPLKLTAKAVSRAGKLSIEQLDFHAGTVQLVQLQVQGAIKDLTAPRGMLFDFSIRGNEVVKVAALIGQNLPIRGAFSVSGQIADPAERNYKLRDLRIMLGDNHLSGRLDADLTGRNPRLAAELASQELNLKPLTIKTLAPLTELSNLGPLKIAIILAGLNDAISMEKLDLMLGSEELAAITLTGSIKKVSALEGFHLDFSVKGNDLTNLQKLGGPAFPYKGAFHVSGQIVDSAVKNYQISNLNLIWGEYDAKGSVSLNLAQNRPQLTASLTSQKADLRPLLVKTKISDDQKKATVNKKSKVFSSEPWPLESVKKIDADIRVRGKQILLPRLALNDLTAELLIKNGRLSVKPVKFIVGGSGAEAEARFALDSQEKTPTFEMTMKMDQLAIGPMLDELGYKRQVEGTLATNIELSGQGGNLAEVMAGLNGKVFMMMSEGQVASRYLDILEQFLGANILNLFNPFNEKVTQAKVNCLTNYIQIKDGNADCKLLLDSEQTSIFGVGKIDLKTESLNLGIKSNPKKGYGHSKVAKVSVNLGKLSKTLKLSGTLSKPSLAVDTKGAAILVGKFAGGLLFGPFGLAAVAASEFTDFSRGDKNPCLAAIEEAKSTIQATGEAKTAKTEKNDQKGKEPAAEKSDSTVKKIGRKVKNLFKR